MKNNLIKKLVKIPQKQVEDISKAVIVAKGEEEKARDFYAENAEKTSDGEMKRAFEFLAKEEKEHFSALSLVEGALKENGKFAVVSPEVLQHLEKPKIYPEKGAKKSLEENSELSVLLWAMRAETKAKNFYLQQAEKTKVKEVRQFWETLADFEAGHFTFLDGLFSSWTDMQDFIMG
ncbi:MAG TPA: ferritin family protein [archaeon]|nr:ferritin family protein [archaeon]